MWICLNNGFLSIVQPLPKDNAPAGTLLVRARRPDDIERIFVGYAAVTEPRRDYQFRAFIPREVVGKVIAANITAISYTNFKGSVRNRDLAHAYGDFWHIMAKLQPQRPYSDYRTASRKEPAPASARFVSTAPRRPEPPEVAITPAMAQWCQRLANPTAHRLQRSRSGMLSMSGTSGRSAPNRPMVDRLESASLITFHAGEGGYEVAKLTAKGESLARTNETAEA